MHPGSLPSQNRLTCMIHFCPLYVRVSMVGGAGRLQDRLTCLIQCLPPWLRFAQCLRKFWDSGNAMPHLLNAGKYSTVFLMVAFAGLYSLARGGIPPFSEGFVFTGKPGGMWDMADIEREKGGVGGGTKRWRWSGARLTGREGGGTWVGGKANCGKELLFNISAHSFLLLSHQSALT